MTQPPQPPPVPFTREQRECRACINCAGDDGELIPAGHVYVSTGATTAPLGWAVVAHPTCPTVVSQEEQ